MSFVIVGLNFLLQISISPHKNSFVFYWFWQIEWIRKLILKFLIDKTKWFWTHYVYSSIIVRGLHQMWSSDHFPGGKIWMELYFDKYSDNFVQIRWDRSHMCLHIPDVSKKYGVASNNILQMVQCINVIFWDLVNTTYIQSLTHSFQFHNFSCVWHDGVNISHTTTWKKLMYIISHPVEVIGCRL